MISHRKNINKDKNEDTKAIKKEIAEVRKENKELKNLLLNVLEKVSK